MDISDFVSGLQTLSSFISELYRLRACYEIIEYLPNQYANIRKLNDLGIFKEDFEDYCLKIFESEFPEYFTIHSLKQMGFTHKIDGLGYEECFYSSILAEDKVNFSFRRVGGNRLFKKGKSNILFADFVKWKIDSARTLSMSASEILISLERDYNIKVEWHKLPEMISGTTLYYDRIGQVLYQDYELYLKKQDIQDCK